MKIVFRSENGFCPEWVHDGIRYFLFEDYDGTWTLKSRKIGFVKKNKFYRNGIYRVYPSSLLARYFKNKKNVRCKCSYGYTFYYWNGKQYATNGNIITIMYDENYVRPSFSTYLECLNDAKEFLSEKYSDGQMVMNLN